MKHLPSLHICKKQLSKQNLFVFWKITFVELTKKYLEKLRIEKFRLVRIMMMMMLIFCREMVYQKSASNFISSKGYLSELPSQVSDISPALFQPVQKLSLSSVVVFYTITDCLLSKLCLFTGFRPIQNIIW